MRLLITSSRLANTTATSHKYSTSKQSTLILIEVINWIPRNLLTNWESKIFKLYAPLNLNSGSLETISNSIDWITLNRITLEAIKSSWLGQFSFIFLERLIIWLCTIETAKPYCKQQKYGRNYKMSANKIIIIWQEVFKCYLNSQSKGIQKTLLKITIQKHVTLLRCFINALKEVRTQIELSYTFAKLRILNIYLNPKKNRESLAGCHFCLIKTNNCGIQINIYMSSEMLVVKLKL